jgi:hypothetical protein
MSAALPQYFDNPISGLKETVVRDEVSLDCVLAEFEEQPSGKLFFAEYDSPENLRKLLLNTERNNGFLVTWSKIVAQFKALVLLNKTRTQSGDLLFIPVAEGEALAKEARNAQLRTKYGEFESFFQGASSSSHRNRCHRDAEYKIYADRRLEQLSKKGADPKLIPSSLFTDIPAPRVAKETAPELTDHQRAELEQFAIDFRNMTSEQARRATNVSLVGASAVARFNQQYEAARRAGILRTESNLGDAQ